MLDKVSLELTERRVSLKSNKNDALKRQVIDLVEKVEVNYKFTGEFDVYTVYERLHNKTSIEVYALVHTKHNISFEDKDRCQEIFDKEAKILHEELIKNNLNLDYFFIMPYFTRTRRKAPSFRWGM